jgi:DNA-binding transcriptional ArsR family regulator
MLKKASDLEPLRQGADDAAALLRNLAHPQRLLVLCMLIEHGEMTVGELLSEVDLGASALSQHLARLRRDGLVEFRRDAQFLHYRIADPRVKALVATLKTLFCP